MLGLRIAMSDSMLWISVDPVHRPFHGRRRRLLNGGWTKRKSCIHILGWRTFGHYRRNRTRYWTRGRIRGSLFPEGQMVVGLGSLCNRRLVDCLHLTAPWDYHAMADGRLRSETSECCL